MKKINSFRGEYHWLSNFHLVNINYKGRDYPSVEHAFMSAKNETKEWKDFCSNLHESPGIIKKFGRDIPLVPNWESIKIQVMKDCILAKFSQEPFKSKLLETGDTEIIEGNDWGDIYWGYDIRKNKGKNYLGRIIMDTRDFLRSLQ
jgi:ribA/ribD-fused uncharacterized protein